MTKCVGIQFKKGTFSDEKSGREVAYDNVVIHVESVLAPDPNVFGVQVDQVKIKRSALEYMLGGSIEPSEFVGKEILLEYTPIGGKPVLTNIQPVG